MTFLHLVVLTTVFHAWLNILLCTTMGYTCTPPSGLYHTGSAVIHVQHIPHVRGSSGRSNHAKHDYFYDEDIISSIPSIISSRRPEPRHPKVTGVNKNNLTLIPTKQQATVPIADTGDFTVVTLTLALSETKQHQLMTLLPPENHVALLSLKHG